MNNWNETIDRMGVRSIASKANAGHRVSKAKLSMRMTCCCQAADKAGSLGMALLNLVEQDRVGARRRRGPHRALTRECDTGVLGVRH
ncbi:hypothetical protein [Mycobacterium sp.]|uniref:hypothetical protein n=1 Tax=Mycobacterium sp. TaxID=1785 RepID=UPI003F94D40B